MVSPACDRSGNSRKLPTHRRAHGTNVQSYDQTLKIPVQAISSAWASCGSLAFHAKFGDWHEERYAKIKYSGYSTSMSDNGLCDFDTHRTPITVGKSDRFPALQVQV
jgi:hypothetical protein